ncbi:DUF2635 domain-containing protein [Pseudoroseomonas cervicalis]|nr:DUF2635 domain-containing protein [Pseudoroseomonas cervicalis]WBV42731.1 DUF2635 domain-containing protein [Pseudoroseomonas cervicalis]
MFVKPAPGRAVPDPDLRDFLPEEGRDVPRTDYWLRRIRDEDVIEGEAKPASATKR